MENTNTQTEASVEANTKPKSKYTQEELLSIFDEILFSGEYREDVLIKGKLKVTFRSRSVEETTDISRRLDGGNYKLVNTLQEQRALLNLGYSVVGYNNKDLTSQDIEERLKFIRKLPASLIATLSEALVRFDMKTDEACREAEENF